MKRELHKRSLHKWVMTLGSYKFCTGLQTNSYSAFGIRPISSHPCTFQPFNPCHKFNKYNQRIEFRKSLLHIYAPPQSGYQTPEDEDYQLPDTYEPTMEYPGTMRPGRTPENIPVHDLPLADSDPDPVPWPHFQEIDWYHTWGAPHPHPIPMDEFIELEGRWATLEDEAEMRKDARRGVRERREAQEKEKTSHQVMDDTDDDDDITARDLGEGVQDLLTITGDAAKKRSGAVDAVIEDEQDDESPSNMLEDDDDDEEEDEDEEEDDFLLELGLDLNDDDEDDDSQTDDEDSGDEPAFSSDDDSSSDLLRAMQGLIDMDKEEDVDFDEEDEEDDNLDLSAGFVDDADDDDAEVKVVPIENLDENDELDDHDDITFDDDNEYDDGGFDLDIDNEFDSGIGDADGDDDW